MSILKLAGFVLVSLAAGFVGAFVTSPAWYTELALPSVAPPSWVFGPVWTTLYILMGVAAYLVSRSPDSRTAIRVFFFQLLLNACWTLIFFGLRSLTGALIEIVALWVAIVVTIILFKKHSGTAALLLVPYLLWVSFATYLTYAIWSLN